jgi:hypothetical protein
MFSESRCLVIAPEQPAATQDRYDVLDKGLGARGFDVWHQIEPINRASQEPLYNRRSKLFRAADD